MKCLKKFHGKGHEVGLVLNISPKDEDIYLIFDDDFINELRLVQFFSVYQTDDNFGDECTVKDVFIDLITETDKNYGEIVDILKYEFYIKLNKDEVNLDARH